MADSPISDKSIYVSLMIKVDGVQIDDTYQLKEVEVYKAVNRVPRAHFLIYDGSVSKSDFEISNAATFLPGSEVEIFAGYESGSNLLFKGIITKHELQLRSGKSFLVIECRDKAAKMTTSRKNAFYSDKKDSDVFETLIGNSNLEKDVDATSETLAELVQYDVSDWDFMLIRAEINGLLVTVSDGKVSVKKPDFSASAQLKLTYGIDLIDFNAVMSAEHQVKAVGGYAWDYSKQDVAQTTSATPKTPGQGNVSVSNLAEAIGPDEYRLQTSGNLSDEQMKDWVNAKHERSALAAFKCRFKFQGSEKATVGSMIEIAGMGDRFNGNAFISSVRHVIKGGDWLTEVETGMEADWFSEEVMNIESPPAAGLNTSVQGFHYGVVKKIDGDPENQFRVLVTLPLMENSEVGKWARLANFYSSKGFGAFFMPEIGDEVIVGFVNDNPDFPVILGSLYSSGRTPLGTYTPDDKNTYKAIVTKSQLKIEFEDEKKIITIVTPGNNSICVNDDEGTITIEDQTKNSAVFSKDGIAFKSPKDITLNADGNIEINAIGNLTMSASQNVDISGLEISSSAQTSYSASGNASAEFSSSGTCTVKGAMVMIN
jgi:Rhs element Vgr protein